MSLSKFIRTSLPFASERMNRPAYTPVDGKEPLRKASDDETVIGEGEAFLPHEKIAAVPRRAFRTTYWRLGIEVLLLTASFTAMILTFNPPQKPLKQRQLECGRLLGQWLPDAENGVEYEVQRFKGSFGLQSPFTGIGPEVDAAWDNITDGPVGGAIGITKEQWEAVNEHEYPVLLEKDYGTGQYLASLDVFHQLHCVDLLRKSIHREYYDKHEGSFAGAPESVVQGHLTHCIETLRQTLMCHGDISLLTYNWVEGREMPHPNFNTVHTCKKWDTLIRWNMQRDISVEWQAGGGKKMMMPPTKPKNVKGLATPP